jgi:hypothetical protein
MKNNQFLLIKLTNWVKPLMVLVLFVLGSNTNCVFAQNWNEIIKTVASDRGAFDYFGYSVAISGDYAIVGAPREDHDATGGDSLSDAGSAYIFKNIAGIWTEVQKIVASDRGANDRFGSSVAISGDYAIVGATLEDHDETGGDSLSDAGSAYIFKNNAGTWSQVQKIVASDRGAGDQFGVSVAISGDYVLVGALYEDEDTTGGNTLNIAGSAYIFKNNAGIWSQVQKIVASDRGAGDQFGFSVAISGDYAIVGAFDENEDTTGGNTLSGAGSAYIFKNNSGTWTQMQKIVASDRGSGDQFGWSVAISGDYAIVGANLEDHNETGGSTLNNAGSAYIFKNNAGIWSQVQKIVASDRGAGDEFGRSVAISGDYAIVGAWLEDHDATGGNTLNDAGSAYIFKNNSGTWSQVQKIVASDRGAIDYFGRSVAISGDYAIVGAYLEDEDATGGNTLFYAGSAYIFKNCATSGTDVQIACDSLTWIDGNTYTSSNNTAKHTLTNAAGCDSVVTLSLTINNSNTGTDIQTACDSYTWIDNVTYTTSNNTAKHTLTNAAGCDSVVTLDLTINNVSDITTSTSGLAISANNASATYQWLDCDSSFAVIIGETGQTFTATANGNYAVELTENGCVDTTACVAITTVGILENSFGNRLLVYPNPTNGNFSIDLGAIYENAQITIMDISGKLIDSKNISQSQVLNLAIEVPAGMYIVSIQAGNKKAVIRLVKE